MVTIDGELERILDRLDFLCRHPPHCEACGTEQVQIIDYIRPPATWRCRICKHGFTNEPAAGPAPSQPRP